MCKGIDKCFALNMRISVEFLISYAISNMFQKLLVSLSVKQNRHEGIRKSGAQIWSPQRKSVFLLYFHIGNAIIRSETKMYLLAVLMHGGCQTKVGLHPSWILEANPKGWQTQLSGHVMSHWTFD